MKYAELIKLSDGELAEQLEQLRVKLTRMKLAHFISPLPSPAVIKSTRKIIARIKTLQRVRIFA